MVHGSHLPDQPAEVPFRFVEHQEPFERIDTEGRDYLGGVGAVREREWWGGSKENEEESEEIRRKEEARSRLGGFGFQA